MGWGKGEPLSDRLRHEMAGKTFTVGKEGFKMKFPSWPPQPEFHPDNFLCYFVKEGYFHETLGIITWYYILLPRTSSSLIRSVGRVQAGMLGHGRHAGTWQAGMLGHGVPQREDKKSPITWT